MIKKVFIKKAKEKLLKLHHPWCFQGAIQNREGNIPDTSTNKSGNKTRCGPISKLIRLPGHFIAQFISTSNKTPSIETATDPNDIDAERRKGNTKLLKINTVT